MSAPEYREFAPRQALAPYVHCIWTFAGPADDTPQPIAPDGRPELIVHAGAPYLERSASGDAAQPRVLFAGQISEPLTLVAAGDVNVIGVRFHPYAARAFLGVDADVATNQRLDLRPLHSEAQTLDHNVAGLDADAGLRLVQNYVETRMVGAEIDADVKVAVEMMFAGGEAERPAHIAERQWQRRFKAEIGVSPRQLQTVLRFRRVFDAIEHPETSGWIEAALKAGYFDQPQMARDFRRFLGCTAREWAARADGLAKALAASETYKTA